MKYELREFWKVVIRDYILDGIDNEYYVFAKNAAEAEKRALCFSKEESSKKNPYCYSVQFIGYVK